MSENILSTEDLKFLERLYDHYGIHTLRFDDDGIKNNNKLLQQNFEGLSYLSEISKKLKFRLNSNVQLNFLSAYNFDVVKI